MESVHYYYDSTFDGFLSVVFYAFERNQQVQKIEKEGAGVQDLFSETVAVPTETAKAERVWKGLVKKTSAKNARLVQLAFMSELTDVEMLLWRYLRKVFTSQHPDFYQNMLDEDVYNLMQTARKVTKEAHRFQGFVRFQQTADNIFFAPIDPEHDILPLLIQHFKSRYADQQWVIYDTRRKYGIYYDLKEVSEVQIENPEADLQTGQLNEDVKDKREDDYVALWQRYYNSVNIASRENKKQMTRLMPRRYWKYLPEKNRE